MNHDNHSNYTSHSDVWKLLPWHVNETLDENECLFVEKHLKVCVSCRIEAANLKKLATGVSHSQTMELAASSSFSHLKERIGLSPEPTTPTLMVNPFNRIKGWLTSRPLLVATTLVIVTVVTVSTYFLTKYQIGAGLLGTEYRTLSKAKVTPLDLKDIRVEFAEDMMQNRIDRIIDSIDGIVVDGSSHDRVFHIRIKNSKLIDFNQLVAVIAQLEEHSGVVSARPIAARNTQN